jgi:hypothetical protein
MSGPTLCYHCGNRTEDNGGMVWATVRIAGYLDEFDVTLCATCTHRLFTPAMRGQVAPLTPEQARERQRSAMRDA